ncbi:MAG: glycosyltransferase, partial [Planctomycetota bacterium]
DAPILLHPGSAGRRKGLGVLLDAYARLASRRVPAPFLYRVGPNDLRARHREQLARMVRSGQAAEINRYVSTADLADAFAACDWVAMPYRKFRHSSGVLALARAANRPVVAPDYGHIAQQVRDGQPGRLYRHGSTPDLARVVATLKPDEALSAPTPGRDALRSVEAAHRAFVANLSNWVARIDQETSG